MSQSFSNQYTAIRAFATACILWQSPSSSCLAQEQESEILSSAQAVRRLVVNAEDNLLNKQGEPDRDAVITLSNGLNKIWKSAVRKAAPLDSVRIAAGLFENVALTEAQAQSEVQREFLKRVARDTWHRMARDASPVDAMQAVAQILAVCPLPEGRVQNDVQAELIKNFVRKSWEPFSNAAAVEDASEVAIDVWEVRPQLARPEQDRLARELFTATLGRLTEAAMADNPTFLDALRLAEKQLDRIPDDVDRNMASEVMTTALARFYQKELSWCRQDDIDFMRRDFTVDGMLAVLNKVLTEVPEEEAAILRASARKVAGNDRYVWAPLYLDACKARCRERLSALVKDGPLRLVFAQHWNIGGQHFAYTENLSTPHGWRTWTPGGGLYLHTLRPDLTENVELLLDAGEDGCIRDPDVHWDGNHILFAWKKSDREDDYHLYEMELASRHVRQLTFGLGDADYEGVYLPNDDILFTSTRCVQVIDCFSTDVSNFYICDRNGEYLRRVSFDQVTVNYPQVLSDGRVIYTRWEYNDRGQIYPQPLFVMNADGTAQTEYYGNNSYFPNTIGHARPIPGSTKVIAIASGHHSHQVGGLIRIDVNEGRQEDEGCTYVAPVERKAPRFDAPPEHGGLYTHPYPLNEKEYIAGYSTYMRPKYNSNTGFGIYYVREDGAREQLVYDPEISSSQPVLLKERQRPVPVPSTVNYSKDYGTYYMQDVYQGPGMAGIKRGEAKRLRVVQPLWRVSRIGNNGNRGPAGGASVSTPTGVRNTSWDPKVILGETPIEEDGSAYFKVPARTPVYFQVTDQKGHVIQTMRSWSTLMPGENFSCVGCHEHKSAVPLSVPTTGLAMKRGLRELEPFWGPPRGFSFAREIQPILDKHCISCHDGEQETDEGTAIFSLLSTPVNDARAKRVWSQSYVNLTLNGDVQIDGEGCIGRAINWLSPQSSPTMIPPRSAGSCKSELMTMLQNAHGETELSREEYEKIAAWIDLTVPYCGDYLEANAWDDRDWRHHTYFSGRRRAQETFEAENLHALVSTAESPSPKASPGGPEFSENIALNVAAQHQSGPYPRITASSEYRNKPCFWGLNVVDGRTENSGHGPKFPSWGPDQEASPWINLDFGGPVEVDRVVIFLRADFPHDGYWRSGLLEFSDGSTIKIDLKETANGQTVSFPTRRTTSLKLRDLKWAEPNTWCALSELEVWGRRIGL